MLRLVGTTWWWLRYVVDDVVDDVVGEVRIGMVVLVLYVVCEEG